MIEPITARMAIVIRLGTDGMTWPLRDGIERVRRGVDAVLEQQGDAEAGAERSQRGDERRDAHVADGEAVDEPERETGQQRGAQRDQRCTTAFVWSPSMSTAVPSPDGDQTQGLHREDLAEHDAARNRQVDAGGGDHERGADADHGQDGDVLRELPEVRGRVELARGLDRERDDDHEQRPERDHHGAVDESLQRRLRRLGRHAGAFGLGLGGDFAPPWRW